MNYDKRLTPIRPNLADERLRGRVEAPHYVAGTPRRVTAPSAGLSRQPSPEASLDTQALMGEAVTLFDEHEGWAWVQLERDGYVGYIPSEALGPPDPAPTHKVAALRTVLYPGPSLKLPHTGFLSLGATVTVVREQGDYAQVAPGGWVFRGHLGPLDAFEPDFVSVAERFVGTPYLWGGKTSLGLDCSGLIQVALAAAGLEAPRDSDMQEAALGSPLPVTPELADLRRGDLIFWKGHVGVMLDAERLLHANGHHMMTAVEPLAEARERILAKSYGAITAVKRLARLGG